MFACCFQDYIIYVYKYLSVLPFDGLYLYFTGYCLSLFTGTEAKHILESKSNPLIISSIIHKPKKYFDPFFGHHLPL